MVEHCTQQEGGTEPTETIQHTKWYCEPLTCHQNTTEIGRKPSVLPVISEDKRPSSQWATLLELGSHRRTDYGKSPEVNATGAQTRIPQRDLSCTWLPPTLTYSPRNSWHGEGGGEGARIWDPRGPCLDYFEIPGIQKVNRCQETILKWQYFRCFIY